MDFLPELLKQGSLGVVAAIFLWLYLGEKKDHKATRDEVKAVVKEKETLMEARRVDAVETRTDVTSMLPVISQSLQNISDKITISKEAKRIS